MSAHNHDHPGHDHHEHGHGRHGHVHASPGDPRYGLAIVLNLAIVLVEAGGGVIGHSTALVADAGHNLSDVLGLVLAGGAAWLARRPAAGRRTYGFGKATIMAALANGLVLMLVSGGLLFEAVQRLVHPEPIQAPLVMGVAAVGVVVNTLTALMFVRGQASDANVRGVFLHMAADAAVSVGVIIAAGLILLTGWSWVDPAVSIAIVAVIAAGTWGLLREAVDMALDAAPRGADPERIEAFLRASPGVVEVHDLHVWAMSTTETALTAHVVRPQPDGIEQFRCALAQSLESRFGVRHATLQIEQSRGEHCPGC
ncbi:MAG TPA: cation diffusion facilitator family transporter [Caulobacteraceae bacterium]|nr:cation diffusion facilitator family transporter [Caulobacteraceae bacterium]